MRPHKSRPTQNAHHAAALTVAACLATAAHANPTNPIADHPDLADLPARWADQTEYFEVPGAAVFVVDEDRIYTATFGSRDPLHPDPVTPDTMFYIASISKTINATAICRLADQGKLTLDDLVKDRLPQFKHPDENLFNTLTIRDLLCHRRGMLCPPTGILNAFSGEMTDERFFYWVNEVPIVQGEVAYNNLHFTLLGRVIEAVTAKSWRDYEEQEILLPAGMTRTTAYASRQYADPDAAFPAQWTPDGFKRADLIKSDRTMHAAGGHAMSANDAARWMLLHLNDGEIDGVRILKPETARAMKVMEARLAEPRTMTGTINGYAHAWQIGELMGLPTFAHGGGYEGAYAYFLACPEQDIAVGVLTNGGLNSAYWSDAVIVDVVERLTDATGASEQWASSRATVEKRKADRAESGESVAEPAPLLTSALSRPIGLYAGWFRNEHLGTIIVTHEDNALSFALGDLALGAAPAEEPDHFVLDRAGPASFILTETGYVLGVELNHPMLGKMEFRR